MNKIPLEYEPMMTKHERAPCIFRSGSGVNWGEIRWSGCLGQKLSLGSGHNVGFQFFAGCHQNVTLLSSIINNASVDSEGHAGKDMCAESCQDFVSRLQIRVSKMSEYKYEIKVKADGYWVGYRDMNGEWQDADSEPYDSFIDAVKYRDFIEERERGPISTAG